MGWTVLWEAENSFRYPLTPRGSVWRHSRSPFKAQAGFSTCPQQGGHSVCIFFHLPLFSAKLYWFILKNLCAREFSNQRSPRLLDILVTDRLTNNENITVPVSLRGKATGKNSNTKMTGKRKFQKSLRSLLPKVS